MSSPLHFALAITALALMFSANPVIAQGQHKPVTADQAQIIDTVSTIFNAASAEDIAKFDPVLVCSLFSLKHRMGATSSRII